MGSIIWGPEVAEVYDRTYPAMFGPSGLGPMVGLLAELARGGPALEFAVGTGGEHHHHVGPFRGLGDFHDLELFGLAPS